MEISRKALIITLVINFLLLAIGTVCVVYLNYSVLSLSLFAAATVFVLVSSVFIYKLGRDYNNNSSNQE